ncbi:MAG: membrane protein insertion efficiency factor YidD [Opitutus sp.]
MTTPSILQLPARALVLALRGYQRLISPVLPVVFGAACGCRFAPSCSHYAIGAIQEHGALLGSGLALRRLSKCNPLHPGGFDPVPRRQPFSCVLTRSSAAQFDSRVT